MVTYQPEYLNKLWEIQNMGLLKRAVLVPHNENIMEIDLNSRKITTPKFLSVSKDHQAETVYFKFDRYFDMIDLTNMVCVIVYKNAKNEEYIYPVPFYDIVTCADERKVLIPWCIQGAATAYAGDVEFSILFFRVDEATHTLTYSLNTLPAVAKVLEGQNWDLNATQLSQITIDNTYIEMLQRIRDLNESMHVYWLDV